MAEILFSSDGLFIKEYFPSIPLVRDFSISSPFFSKGFVVASFVLCPLTASEGPDPPVRLCSILTISPSLAVTWWSISIVFLCPANHVISPKPSDFPLTIRQ